MSTSPYLLCFDLLTGYLQLRIYPNVPMGVAWNGNNIGGSTKRAVGIAMHVGTYPQSLVIPSYRSDIAPPGFGNLGGVIAGFVYRATDAPRYFQGHGVLLATTTMSLFLCLFMHFHLRKANAQKDEEMRAKGLTLDTHTEEMKDAERERGDYASVSSWVWGLRTSEADYCCIPVLPVHYLRESRFLFRLHMHGSLSAPSIPFYELFVLYIKY